MKPLYLASSIAGGCALIYFIIKLKSSKDNKPKKQPTKGSKLNENSILKDKVKTDSLSSGDECNAGKLTNHNIDKKQKQLSSENVNDSAGTGDRDITCSVTNTCDDKSLASHMNGDLNHINNIESYNNSSKTTNIHSNHKYSKNNAGEDTKVVEKHISLTTAKVCEIIDKEICNDELSAVKSSSFSDEPINDLITVNTSQDQESPSDIIFPESTEQSITSVKSADHIVDQSDSVVTNSVCQDESELIEVNSVCEYKSELIGANLVCEDKSELIGANLVCEDKSELIGANLVCEDKSELIGANLVCEDKSELIGANSVCEDESELIGANSVCEDKSELIGANSVCEVKSELIGANLVSEVKSELIGADSVCSEKSESVRTNSICDKKSESVRANSICEEKSSESVRANSICEEESSESIRANSICEEESSESVRANSICEEKSELIRVNSIEANSICDEILIEANSLCEENSAVDHPSSLHENDAVELKSQVDNNIEKSTTNEMDTSDDKEVVTPKELENSTNVNILEDKYISKGETDSVKGTPNSQKHKRLESVNGTSDLEKESTTHSDSLSQISQQSLDSGEGSIEVEPETLFSSNAGYLGHSQEQSMFYQFELGQELVGKLIGKQGTFVKRIRAQTNTNVMVQHHPNPRFRLCTLQGTKEDIIQALKMIREKFPAEIYHNLSLRQINHDHNQTPKAPTFNKQQHEVSLPSGVLVEVRVSTVSSTAEVWVQQPLHPTFSALPRLLDCLNRNYGDNGQFAPPLPDNITKGVICVCKLNNQWHRCLIESSQPPNCVISLLDVGGMVYVPSSSLRQIRTDYMSLPFQANVCLLAGIQPIEEYWTEEGRLCLEEMVNGNLIAASVVAYTEEGTPFINLYLREMSQYTLINEKLVELGHAKWLSDSTNEKS